MFNQALTEKEIKQIRRHISFEAAALAIGMGALVVIVIGFMAK